MKGKETENRKNQSRILWDSLTVLKLFLFSFYCYINLRMYKFEFCYCDSNSRL